MRNLMRGVGLAFYGTGIFLKNAIWFVPYSVGFLLTNAILFVLMPWMTCRRWSEKSMDPELVRFLLPFVYSFISVVAGTTIVVNFGGWYIVLPVLAANALSGLHELGWAYVPPASEAGKPAIPPAETNKENGMNPTEIQVDDPTVPSVARNAYKNEINGLKKALDKDEGKIRFWKWLAIGTLSVVVLLGAATGYMLHKGIMTVDIDGISLAQELEKAQAEIERLKGEIPAIEDAQKKIDEMLERAKDMVPPGILPPEKDKGDDF